MEQSDNGALEFQSPTCVDGRRREHFPDNQFTDISSDEEGDSGSEAIVFLEEFIEEDDDECCREELDDEK